MLPHAIFSQRFTHDFSCFGDERLQCTLRSFPETMGSPEARSVPGLQKLVAYLELLADTDCVERMVEGERPAYPGPLVEFSDNMWTLNQDARTHIGTPSVIDSMTLL